MRLVTCTRYNAKCSACFPRLRLRQDNAWGTSFASAVGSRLVGWSAAKPFSSRSCRASAGTAATATPHAAPVAPLRRWRLPRRRCGGSGLRPNASIEFDEPRGPARGRCFRGGVGRTRRDSATPSPRELRSRRCAGSEPGSDLYSNTGTCTCHMCMCMCMCMYFPRMASGIYPLCCCLSACRARRCVFPANCLSVCLKFAK